jgi:uroporphyrinogen-III synthase
MSPAVFRLATIVFRAIRGRCDAPFTVRQRPGFSGAVRLAMAIRPLDGFVVGVTADARRDDQAELLARRGAVVVAGPVLSCVAAPEPRLRELTEQVIARPPDVLVATTATGMRMWFGVAEQWGRRAALTAALSTSFVAARGEKTVNAMNAVELTVWWQPPLETSDEIVAHLLAQGVAGKRIAVQLDGGGSSGLCDALASAGADVLPLAVYEWRLPDDNQRVLSLIDSACDGRLDAVTFTAAPAVHNLFAIARRHELDASLAEAFAERVLCACLGPASAAAARREGVPDPVVPPRSRLGSLVQALAERLSATRRVLVLRDRKVMVQGSLAIIDGQHVVLSGRERAVFEALARRPGAVIAKARLARDVWGSAGSTRAVDTTVSRLRRRLGPAGPAVRTTRNRGYWLDAVLVDPEWTLDVEPSVSST